MKDRLFKVKLRAFLSGWGLRFRRVPPVKWPSWSAAGEARSRVRALCRVRHASPFALESLEARVLLSADLAGAAKAAQLLIDPTLPAEQAEVLMTHEGQPNGQLATAPQAGTDVASFPRKLTQRPEVASILAQPVQADQPAIVSSISLLSAVAPPPVVGGLVAAYGFSEGSGGTTADSSGSGNTGTLVDTPALGGQPTWTTGIHGGALTFDGGGQVLISAAPSLDLTTAMTLEAWVNPTVLPESGWRGIIHREVDSYFLHASDGDSGEIGVLRPAGGGEFEDGSGFYKYTAAQSALPVNAWSHLAVTWDGTTLRLYVNGTQVASMLRDGAITTETGQLHIGGNQFEQNFIGQIDDVRIYNRALSPAEIQTNMDAPKGADCLGPRVRPGGSISGTG